MGMWFSAENLVASWGKTVIAEVFVMKGKVIESPTVTYSTFKMLML